LGKKLNKNDVILKNANSGNLKYKTRNSVLDEGELALKFKIKILKI
jgi:hypothetical protein